MKIDGKISIRVECDYTSIEVRDDNACTTFLEVILTPLQLSSALSRLSNTECSLELNGLDRVGKKHENKTFEFPIKYSDSQSDLELACNEALFEKAMFEWIPDHYYRSQNTFFRKGDEKWARVIIRRWSDLFGNNL